MISAATFRLDGRLAISHTVQLADAGRGFELAGDKSQAMKVQIAFGA